MVGVENETYDWVYSSHCLEDLSEPSVGIKNWWRLVKPDGYLIIFVPHRDLLEHKKTLPACTNINHQWYFLPDRHDPPVTLGLLLFIQENLNDYELIYIKKCDENYSCEFIPDNRFEGGFLSYVLGEQSIELVIRKNGTSTIYLETYNGQGGKIPYDR